MSRPLVHRIALAAALACLALARAALAGDPCPCLGDFNKDGFVNGADLGILLGGWGPGGGEFDLSADGMVDGADLGMLLALWGPCGPPANDLCVDASELASVHMQQVDFCTVGASDVSGPTIPNCDGFQLPLYRDIWYRVTTPDDGLLHVSTCGTNFDTALAVYGSIVGNSCACPGEEVSLATMLGCNDDSCGIQAELEIPATAGRCYSIRVGGFNGYQGSGLLTVRNIKRGDRRDIPHVLPSMTFLQIDGTTANDTWITVDESSCSSNDTKDEWFIYVMPCDGLVTFHTCHPQTNFDTTLTVFYTGSQTNEIACNDDALSCNGSLNSSVTVAGSSGTVLLIRVSGFEGDWGDFRLTIDADCIG